jgi:glyoxylase-like metal-dependent hydrolase (beta-lactamase superfamily II)
MKKYLTAATMVALLFTQTASAQEAKEPVQIKRSDLGNGIYMLEGAGGNVGVSVGDDGVFIIDDQFDYMADSILANIKEISDQPLKYVFNTHWHGDHTGGNEHMHKSGGTIVAHDNVRARLEKGTDGHRVVPPAHADALPTITFSEEMSLHLNGHHIKVIYVPNAHTDGDAMVYFTDLNILHTGDTMLTGKYPFIDVDSGGSALGYIANLKRVLAMIDKDTKVMPGHGTLGGKAEVQALYDMLIEIQTSVAKEITAGKSNEDIIATLTFPQWKDMEWFLGSAEKTVTRLLAEMR